MPTDPEEPFIVRNVPIEVLENLKPADVPLLPNTVSAPATGGVT
jgi:hypothetical protein